MNGALSPEVLRGSEMTVLERQRARLKWHQEQSYFDDLTGAFSSQSSRELGFRPGYMCGGDSVFLQTKPDPGLESGWPDLLNVKILLPGLVCGSGGSGNGSSPETNFAPRTSGGSPATAEENRQDSSGQENVSSGAGRESFKKRKAVHLQHTKVVVDDELSQTKECAEEGDSKITEQNTKKSCSKKSIKKETSTTTAKENSKASVVEKPDYIHVRARRGQATDSHSLAERVRREKISERMKYLQGLVPGCDKITGKAGMLDEIINYVQSLQRQIEFLSLKLATVNPRLDFNIDNLLTKEIIHASTSSFQTCGILSETTNPAYLQLDASQQQVGSSCGLDMGMSSPDMGLRRATYAPISSVPDAFLGPSCFTQTQPSTSWDVELQSLYSMVFDQGKAI